VSDEEQSEKTEPASEKRRREYREKGEVARSQELTSAVMLMTGVMAVSTIAKSASTNMPNLVRMYLGSLHDHELWLREIAPRTIASVGLAVATLAPGFGLLVLAAFAVNLAQVGWLWAPKSLGPNFGKLNPFAGLKRLIASKQAFANLLKTLAKVTFVGLIAAKLLSAQVGNLPQLVAKSPVALAQTMGAMVKWPLIVCAMAMFVVGAAHFAWTKYDLEERMKMTRDEAKREHKDSDGDPQIKNRRRQMHRERLSANQLIDTVPTATVIINNPTHYSVAIRYSAKDGVPIIVAKGVDYRALRIREIARDSDIEMVDSPPLARALHRHVDVGDVIPEQFFRAVAEILALVLMKQQEHADRRG
jgi:flagellar biosynthetic protein FlhB